MTMDLIGPQGDRTFTHTAWMKLIKLACDHGWQPAGALPPDDQHEIADDEEAPSESNTIEVEESAALPASGADLDQLPADQCRQLENMIREAESLAGIPNIDSYILNSGYRVFAEDAHALAAALERALPDVPDHDAVEHKTFEDPRLPGVRLYRPGEAISPVEAFSGENKAMLTDFIAFCRQGGFEIR